MKKLALAICNTAIIGSLALGSVASVSAAAPTVYTNLTSGLSAISSSSGTTKTLPDVITGLLNVMFGILGIIAVLLVIFSGWQWMTGGEEGVKKAKKRMTNAAIGLLLLLTAYAITNYVISALQTATQ